MGGGGARVGSGDEESVWGVQLLPLRVPLASLLSAVHTTSLPALLAHLQAFIGPQKHRGPRRVHLGHA